MEENTNKVLKFKLGSNGPVVEFDNNRSIIANLEARIADLENTIALMTNEYEYFATWDYVWNEASWNAAYNKENSALRAYYETYPDEDLWNETANRAANFNDKRYTVEVYTDAAMESDFQEKQFDALWFSDTVQKLTNVEDNTEVYYTDMFYSLDDNSHELFNDSAMTESANEFAKFTSFTFANCTHCWKGSINAPGAAYPWCVVNTPIPFTGVIKLTYDNGEPVYPWGEATKTFKKGFAICSIPTELGMEYKLDSNGNSTFNSSKLKVRLIK